MVVSQNGAQYGDAFRYYYTKKKKVEDKSIHILCKTTKNRLILNKTVIVLNKNILKSVTILQFQSGK